jgi:methionyl-tRNA synthetase
LAEPVIPFSARRIWKILNLDRAPDWNEAGKLMLKENHQIDASQIIFRKIEDDIIHDEIDKLKAASEDKPKAPSDVSEIADPISINRFQDVDLRVAEIIHAEPVKKTDRLLKLNVQVGPEQRQIIAGVAGYYEPQALIGKKIVIVANLEPAKIKGLESQGMLLAAQTDKGMTLLTVMDEDFPTGSKIG